MRKEITVTMISAAVIIAAVLISYNYVIIPTGTSKVTSLDNVIIKMERLPCYGICPWYSLTIYGDGTVNYEGFRFVKTVGNKTFHISPDTVAQLVDKFYEINYFSLDERYEISAGDNYAVNTTITIDSYSKSVYRYADTGPQKLQSLEKMIDDATNSYLLWQKTDPDKPRTTED